MLNEEDINHLLAVNIAKNLKGSKILIPAMVIAELMSNTRNKRARECTIKATLKTADEIPTLDDSNLIRYIDFAGNLPNTFTAIDSIILFLAKENNARLITFDKKLQKLYKGA